MQHTCNYLHTNTLYHNNFSIMVYMYIPVCFYSMSRFHSRCLELDPGNLPAHMSLAVCYTNESQQIKVVKVPVCRMPALEAELQCYHSNAHSQCEVHSITVNRVEHYCVQFGKKIGRDVCMCEFCCCLWWYLKEAGCTCVFSCMIVWNFFWKRTQRVW